MAIKISVIVPVYNVEKYLRQCLDSIVNQTFRNLDIILIDDDSPDNCGKICDEYAMNDSRVKVIHKENEGVGPARNDGIRAAEGEWIAFADSDDWYDLDYFEKMVELLPKDDTEVFFAGGCYAESLNDSFLARTFGGEKFDKNVHDRSFLLNKTLAVRYGMGNYPTTSSLGAPWNKLYRTSFLRENNLYYPYKLHPGEEILFNISVFCAASKIDACDCVGYHYRTQIDSSSLHRFNDNWPKMSERFMKELFKIIGDGTELGISKECINARAFQLIYSELNCYFFHPSNQMTYRELAREINEMKKKPYFHNAIYSSKNSLITPFRRILKFTLSLPSVWPLKQLCKLKQKVKGHI